MYVHGMIPVWCGGVCLVAKLLYGAVPDCEATMPQQNERLPVLKHTLFALHTCRHISVNAFSYIVFYCVVVLYHSCWYE